MERHSPSQNDDNRLGQRSVSPRTTSFPSSLLSRPAILKASSSKTQREQVTGFQLAAENGHQVPPISWALSDLSLDHLPHPKGMRLPGGLLWSITSVCRQEGGM